MTDFSHVSTWVFDLDNTLYPPSARLFDQIEVKMTEYVMREIRVDRAEADRLREYWWRTHGTTLSGMMQDHDIDPLPYLQEVHDIDLSHLSRDALLQAGIKALPGRRIVYTNGSEFHAERVLAARGLRDCFDAIYGIEHAGFVPKPMAEAFAAIIARDGFEPDQAAMFEDERRNLKVPFDLGMRTVLVGPGDVGGFVEAQTEDLAGFVSALV